MFRLLIAHHQDDESDLFLTRLTQTLHKLQNFTKRVDEFYILMLKSDNK